MKKNIILHDAEGNLYTNYHKVDETIFSGHKYYLFEHDSLKKLDMVITNENYLIIIDSVYDCWKYVILEFLY